MCGQSLTQHKTRLRHVQKTIVKCFDDTLKRDLGTAVSPISEMKSLSSAYPFLRPLTLQYDRFVRRLKHQVLKPAAQPKKKIISSLFKNVRSTQ